MNQRIGARARRDDDRELWHRQLPIRIPWLAASRPREPSQAENSEIQNPRIVRREQATARNMQGEAVVSGVQCNRHLQHLPAAVRAQNLGLTFTAQLQWKRFAGEPRTGFQLDRQNPLFGPVRLNTKLGIVRHPAEGVSRERLEWIPLIADG